MLVSDMITSLGKWMREDVDADVALDAITDSVASIWETLICIALSEFLGGPTTATFATGNPKYAIPADADAGVEGGNAGDQDDIWYIHQMQTTMPDGTKRFWEGTEIGSELWRKFARSTAGNTPYQPYVYDFDGATITVAPDPAQALTPGYFYIKRPPKMAVGATIPFKHPAVPAFIRYNALSLILLSVSEAALSAQWMQKAELERQRIIMSSARKNERKNLRVQPLFK